MPRDKLEEVFYALPEALWVTAKKLCDGMGGTSVSTVKAQLNFLVQKRMATKTVKGNGATVYWRDSHIKYRKSDGVFNIEHVPIEESNSLTAFEIQLQHDIPSPVHAILFRLWKKQLIYRKRGTRQYIGDTKKRYTYVYWRDETTKKAPHKTVNSLRSKIRALKTKVADLEEKREYTVLCLEKRELEKQVHMLQSQIVKLWLDEEQE